MHKPTIGLSLEGLPFILFTSVATLTFALLDCWFMATVLLVALFFVLNFFRDPERVVPQEPGVAVSPADGLGKAEAFLKFGARQGLGQDGSRFHISQCPPSTHYSRRNLLYLT